MNKPTTDNDFEAAVEVALDGLKLEPEVNYEKAKPINSSNEPHANLIDKSRVSFTKQLEALQTRIDVVNSQIGASIKARDEAVTMAENLHKDRMREHERDLYQIKTLRAAVELAVAALGYE